MQLISLFLSAAALATAFGLQEETSTTSAQPEIKQEAAAGRRRHRNRDRDHHHSYPEYYGPQYLPPLLQDRYVCDIDASVLLVTETHRRHQFGANRGIRVKCSEVASYDEESCNLCCQQTARRDTSLGNAQLFGFLSLTNGRDEEEAFNRPKRDTHGHHGHHGHHDDDDDEDHDDDDDDDDEDNHHNRRFYKAQPTYLTNANWSPKKYHSNVKCICCAPRTTITNSGAAAQSPPTNTQTYGAVPVTNIASAPAQGQLVDAWQSGSTWGAAADTGSAPGTQPVTQY